MTDAEIAKIQERSDWWTPRIAEGRYLPTQDGFWASMDRVVLLAALLETRDALRDSNGILESIRGEGREQALAQVHDNRRVLGEV